MRDNRRLLEFLFSLTELSPHAAEHSRRQIIRAATRLGLGAGAAVALDRMIGAPLALAADAPTLPEITSIPEKLKGSGVVRVCSYGGAFQDAQRKAYFEPFERLSGIKVIESQGPDIVKLKAMLDTNNIEYDVGEFDRAGVIDLTKKGDYWEEIDYSLVDVNN